MLKGAGAGGDDERVVRAASLRIRSFCIRPVQEASAFVLLLKTGREIESKKNQGQNLKMKIIVFPSVASLMCFRALFVANKFIFKVESL